MSQLCTEVNVKRLGEQQKKVLRYLYENREKLYQQTEIIEDLYGAECVSDALVVGGTARYQRWRSSAVWTSMRPYRASIGRPRAPH